MKNIMSSDAQFIVTKERRWRFRELDKFEAQGGQIQMEALMYGARPPKGQSRNEWNRIILRSKKRKKPLLSLYITPTSFSSNRNGWLAFSSGGFYGWCPEAPPPERTNGYLSVVRFVYPIKWTLSQGHIHFHSLGWERYTGRHNQSSSASPR